MSGEESLHQGGFLKIDRLIAFEEFMSAIKTGRIAPRIAEVAFTLEALKKRDRQAFMKLYEAKIDCAIDDAPRLNGMVALSFSIGPDVVAHPGNNPILYEHLIDALKIGFKIIRCVRVAGIINPDIDESFFVKQSQAETRQRMDLCSECAEEIERLGGGISPPFEIGARYASTGEPWHMGLKKAPDAEAANIAKALAEWADGDAIAAHAGYRNDYFCTRDLGKSAGASSILAPAKRAILETKFKVNFTSPDELCSILVPVS